MVADVVNKLSVALRYPVDGDFMPLVSSTLLERMPEALPEPHAEQYLGAGRFQQDLMHMWLKLWKEQRTSGLLPYGHFGVQLLVLRSPTDGEELRSEPATWEPAAEADNDAEKDASEEMQWVTRNQKADSDNDTSGYNVRSWPRRMDCAGTL